MARRPFFVQCDLLLVACLLGDLVCQSAHGPSLRQMVPMGISGSRRRRDQSGRSAQGALALRPPTRTFQCSRNDPKRLFEDDIVEQLECARVLLDAGAAFILATISVTEAYVCMVQEKAAQCVIAGVAPVWTRP